MNTVSSAAYIDSEGIALFTYLSEIARHRGHFEQPQASEYIRCQLRAGVVEVSSAHESITPPGLSFPSHHDHHEEH